jgi:tetratricopeptide (TPR) repeat protein
MHLWRGLRVVVFAALCVGILSGCDRQRTTVERPEMPRSERDVMYDSASYVKLESMWKKYLDANPSEDAHVRWLYALRNRCLNAPRDFSSEYVAYAKSVEQGLEDYPENPLMLFLAAVLWNGDEEIQKRIAYLEKATRLDSDLPEPWFSLILPYLAQGEHERLNVVLRRILEHQFIPDAVLDCAYNMLLSVDSNAVLITNGDEDYFSCLLLTHLLRIRSDVLVVCWPQLATTWYTRQIFRSAAPAYFDKALLDSIRERCMRAATIEHLPDTLCMVLAAKASRSGRPVYAVSEFNTSMIPAYFPHARPLGLVTLLTSSDESPDVQSARAARTWLTLFRTHGLKGWSMLHARDEYAARRFCTAAYVEALRGLLPRIDAKSRTSIVGLFRWYREHLDPLLTIKARQRMVEFMTQWNAIPEIARWCSVPARDHQ